MTERHTRKEDARQLKDVGYVLEVAPSGRRYWREPGTGQLLSGDHAEEFLRLEEIRTLEEAGWERVEDEADTYWRRPDTGRLSPRRAPTTWRSKGRLRAAWVQSPESRAGIFWGVTSKGPQECSVG